MPHLPTQGYIEYPPRGMLRDGRDIEDSIGEVRGCGFLLLIYLKLVVVVVNNITIIVVIPEAC